MAKKKRILSENEQRLIDSAVEGSFNENYAKTARVDVIRESYITAARTIKERLKHDNEVALRDLKEALHNTYKPEDKTHEQIYQELKLLNREPLMLIKGNNSFANMRNDYAHAIKYARKAGDEKLANYLKDEYNSLKEKAEGIIEQTRNPKRSLLRRLIASALILVSGFFILFSTNGLTGNVIINEGASSNLPIILATLVLISGVFLFIKK
jgi:hypothetical protein